MARFHGVLTGRGRRTCSGTIADGLTGRIRGWRCGIKVDAGVDDLGRDAFLVSLTGGSEQPLSEPLFCVRHNADGTVDLEVLHEKLGHAPGAFPIRVREGK